MVWILFAIVVVVCIVAVNSTNDWSTNGFLEFILE